MERLVESGMVKAKGSKRGRSFHLSAGVYRRLGEKSAYIRRRGFEPIQQEQMILQFIETHGKITRKDVIELCRITAPQAYRALKSLETNGLISRNATKGRNVAYEKARK